jgi:hypothetical protein
MKILLPNNDENNKRRKIIASGGYVSDNKTQQSRKYPTSTTVNQPITKNAQFAGSGANVVFTQPMFFSPLHTPQNWQIASKRREVYQWSYLDPCFLTLGKDFSIASIKDWYTSLSNGEDIVYIPDKIQKDFLTLNANAEISKPDIISRHYANKKANEISTTGVFENLNVTYDHNCIIIKREDIKCHKSIWNNKLCVCNKNAPTCQNHNCQEYQDKEYIVSTVKASDIKKGDFVLIPFNTTVKNNDLITNKYEAQYAGFLAADGWVINTEKTKISSICMHVDEKEHLEPAINFVFKRFGASVRYKTGLNSYVVSVGSGNLKLHKYSSQLISGKSNSKKFTENVVFLEPELQKYVLGAYIQSDGTWNKTNKCIEITTYSPHLANQLLTMFYRCGILARGNKQKLSKSAFKSDNQFRYIINIPSSECSKINDYVPGKCKNVEMKENRDSKRFFWKNYVVAAVSKNRSYNYEGFVYDIRVPNKFTVVANGIGVHQCRFYYTNESIVAAGVDFYCFEPNTQVLMADGTQQAIMSIEEGDAVRSHDGSVNYVEKIHKRQAQEEMLRISVAGVNIGSLKVTKGHEILTEKDGKIQFVQASKLKENDFLLTPCDYDDNNNYSVDNDFAWILGLYAAEGCGIPYKHVSKKGHQSEYFNGVVFVLSINELDTLGKKLKEKIQKVYRGKKVTIREVPEAGRIEVKVFGQDITNDMIGLCPGTAKYGSKMFSNIVLRWSKENLLHLLAGFLDGDGCFNKNNGFQGVGVARKLCEQIANICDNLGIEYSYTSTRLDKYNRQTLYNIRISRRACDIFKNLTIKHYDNNVDNSKARNIPYFIKGKYIYRKINSIKSYYYEGYVYDLTISNKSSYVVHRIAVHNSNFSMNGFKLECKSKKILKFYERLIDKLKLTEVLNEISHEYFLIGDVFPFLEIDCPYCGGKGVKPDGSKCVHPDGSFRSIKIMNPDYVEVKSNPLSNESEYFLIADEELRMIIQRKEPRKAYEKMPKELINMVASGQPIPLSPRCVSHIKHNASPYGTYGTSLLQRLFTILAYKTKLMTANWIIAERLILPVRVVKVGDKERPATEADLQDVVNQLAAVANDPNLTVVTHNAFEYEWYGTSGKIHDIKGEMEEIRKEILDGLMLNQAILNGDAGSYSSAQVGVEVLIRRLENWRNKLKEWVEKHIFLPVAMMQGFYDEEDSKEAGEKAYLYPKLIWEDLQLRDKTNKIQSLMQLYEKGIVSAQTILQELGLDYDSEIEKIRDEQVMASASGLVPGGTGGAGGAMGGMGGGMGGGMPGGDMGGGGMPPAGGSPGGMGGGMDMGMGGGSMGSAPGGMGGGMPGAQAEALPKITKRGGGGNKKNEQQQGPPPKMIKFTKLEQKMYKILKAMDVPHGLFAQYSVKVPAEQRPFVIDFAYPKLGVGVECLHPETIVQTDCGSKIAKDINIGEYLIGKNGDKVEIKNKFINQSRGTLLSIKPRGMSEILVTDNHPFLTCQSKHIRVKREEPSITRTRDYVVPDIESMTFTKASDLNKSSFLMIPKYRNIGICKNKVLNLNKYTEKKSHNSSILPNDILINSDLCWLMGIYAAEGSARYDKKSGSVEFSFHINEVHLSNRVQDLLLKIFNLKSTVRVVEENNCRVVVCSSKNLAMFFVDNFGKLAPNKTIPSWLYQTNNEEKMEFIKAYSEGDGCLRKNKKGKMIYRMISSSEKMLIDVQSLCFSMNLFAHLSKSREPGFCVFNRKNKKTIHPMKGLWELDLPFESSLKKQYREDDNFFYVSIDKTKDIKYIGEVINFETEGKEDSNHTYLVNNIITHNCDGSIWHQREDFIARDRLRDQKLANVGWRIMRFKEEALDEHPDAIRDIVYKNIMESTKSSKKAEENQTMSKYSSVYEYMTNNEEEIGINFTEIPGGYGEIIEIGTY